MIYEAKTSSSSNNSFDAFGQSKATIALKSADPSVELTFNDIKSYPKGTLTVTVTVR